MITARLLRRATSKLLGAVSSIRLLFNGATQYFTHTAWSPSGANFNVGLTYTPEAGDIGVAKTLIAGFLTKNTSDQLVVTYTDTGAVVNTLTLTALALVADTEYDITISSDGNGVQLSAGGQSVSDADVIDPATLSVDTWFADSGGVGGHATGVPTDLFLTDQTLLQGGVFLQGDGSNVKGSIPTITLSGPLRITLDATVSLDDFVFSSANNATWLAMLANGNLSLRINSVLTATSSLNLAHGSNVKIEIERDIANLVTITVDGVGRATNTVAGNLVIERFMSSGSGGQAYAGVLANLTITDLTTGDTYQYFTAGNVDDNGDGTATALNTGNTGAAFNGTVQNFSALDDLVTLPINSHAWAMNQPQASQADTVGTNTGTIQNFDLSMIQ